MHRVPRTMGINKFMQYFIRKSHEISYLKAIEIPRARSLPIVGTKLDFFLAGGANMLHEYIDKRHKQLGHIFRERLGGSTDFIFISDPAMIKTVLMSLEGKYPEHIQPEPWILYEKLYGAKRGLFFMNGEEWFNNRRIMNPHLLRESSVKWLEDPIKFTIAKFVRNWQTEAANGSFKPDLETDFYRLSTDVIISVLLGTDSGLTASSHYDDLLHEFSDSVKDVFKNTNKLYLLPVTWCQYLNLKIWRDFKESVDNSLFLAKKIVQEMLTLKDKNSGLIKKLTEENMSEEMITRIVADFVIAAGDTTAYTLIWNLYLLSKYENGCNEIRERGLTCVPNYIKESMRLYPVAPFLTRILPKDSKLGCYQLGKGTPIIASIYTSGHSEKNFSKADSYLPYRWDRNDSRKKDLENHISSASLPFAVGVRSCIGKKIAMTTLSEAIYQITSSFDINCMNKDPVKAICSQILVPEKPVEMVFSLRKEKN